MSLKKFKQKSVNILTNDEAVRNRHDCAQAYFYLQNKFFIFITTTHLTSFKILVTSVLAESRKTEFEKTEFEKAAFEKTEYEKTEFENTEFENTEFEKSEIEKRV